MKLNSALRLLLVFVLVIEICGHALGQQAVDSSVVTWDNVAMDEARSNNARGLLMVHELAIMHTAMFDAWARYDAVALPTLGHPPRRPEAARTVANKREAISYAAFRVLNDLFPADTLKLEREMTNLGYDSNKEPSDQTTPSGIGLLAADTVLEYRHHDGANQLGDLHPGAYSDYTEFATANTPDLIRDPDHWQPLSGEGDGKSYAQAFYMPHG